MNNRGIIEMGGFIMIWGGLAVVAGIHSLFIARGTHIQKKAIERCVENNNNKPTCMAMIVTWSKNKQVDYIRDKNNGTGNNGYIM